MITYFWGKKNIYIDIFVEYKSTERFIFAGKLLGLKNFIPPFANTTGKDILQGVNYASSSAGLLITTGKFNMVCIYNIICFLNWKFNIIYINKYKGVIRDLLKSNTNTIETTRPTWTLLK